MILRVVAENGHAVPRYPPIPRRHLTLAVNMVAALTSLTYESRP